MKMAKYTLTTVSESQSGPRTSTAPNGSSRCIDYYRTVTRRQDWADVPENGIYAGRSYKLVDVYISSKPDDNRGHLISSSSSPWTE